LQRELDIPVIETIAVKHGGAKSLGHGIDTLSIDQQAATPSSPQPSALSPASLDLPRPSACHPERNGEHARAHLEARRRDRSRVLHPIFGLAILAVVMFLIFQAVFTWATPLHDGIDAGMTAFGDWLGAMLPEGALRSLLVDGVIAGAGAVLVFLPQILILFLFILCLEESGYLPRAAFLLDRMMLAAGLTGRSFIPLLSSFACANSWIMATRSISDPRDRLTRFWLHADDLLGAAARVYFVDRRIYSRAYGRRYLQSAGVVLFTLYVAGIVSALFVAWIIKRLRRDKSEHALIMELPRTACRIRATSRSACTSAA